MMDPRQELEELRRLEELEARARASQVQAAPDLYTSGVSAAKGIPWHQKALANVGAGLADVGLGVKQLWTDMTGTEEESAKVRQQVADKRELDRALADNSFNVPGGDYLAKGLQVAGSAAPTMVIPAGGAMTAGRMLPWATRALGTGMAQGAINPLAEGESRGLNMAVGGALNVATPIAAGGINSVRRMVTKSGAAERAGEQVAKEVTEAAGNKAEREAMLKQTLYKLQTAQRAPGGIPLSTAAQLSDAQLARLEAGSRARNGANWFDFDQGQSRAVGDAFLRATQEAEELGTRASTRSNNWKTNWGAAENFMGPTTWAKDLPQFRANLDIAKMSPEASNPAVRNMLDAITGEIDRLGEGFTPAHLQQIRANLSAKYNPTNPSAFAGAPRDSAARLSVMGEVDRIMNQATGGKWDNVLAGYAQDSTGVRAAKAASVVRGSYIDPATGRVRNASADPTGDVPRITEAGLGRALDAARLPDKTLALSDDAHTRLNEILRALRAQGIVQNVKRSATAGGGSNTASDTIAAQAARKVADSISMVPGSRAIGDRVLKYSADIKDEALAKALQNPDEMIRLIQQQIQRGQPLTPGMEAFMRLISSAPAAAANN